MARTVFVNPEIFSNPRKRRTKKRAAPRRAPARRAPARRRRNAGIVPFTRAQSMRIAANPARRRRNPRRLLGTKIMDSLLNVGTMFLGTGLGASINIFALSQVENPWLRNGLRVMGSVLTPFLLRGSFGSSLASSFLYPTFVEVAAELNLLPGGQNISAEAPATEADIRQLAADLGMSLHSAGNRRYVQA